MRFARLGEAGAETPVLVEGDDFFDLSGLTGDIDGAFFESDGIERARAARSAGQLARLGSATERRVGSPIARPSAVVCVGMNYAAHAAETGSPPPKDLTMFLKTPNTVIGPNDPVTIPPNSVKTDWEVELGIVIGRRASYLDSATSSIDFIAGFVVANDVSERTFQFDVSGGQWSKGKCSAGFNPTGPWLVTPDEVNYSSLRLRSWVNGDPRQDSTTADLIFGVDYIVWHLSQFMVLEPGDLVLTGTPEGVAMSGRFPYLQAGDVLELEVEGLGRQRQSYVAAGVRA